ncbi:NAD(FAD)-utilizing dehydrogenase [Amylibacter marinus]|uniref:NAD(FAD)-utilizing dehydrogenase n=1 Tax=Amylibacter marinus TaxID=1475483 RepID=A0ABQ5VVP4_9RHOB|nr:TIGR03862 family flavoprotein [Amylibacter marinus]GLQ35400.1 NAD(FAD)-utilizing dehydrogenase [Amylibacter marinus]
MIDLCVIGAGPAGLMAAHRAADAGLSVTLVDAMPSMGRKFLMAGKSGLNITKDEPFDQFCAAFGASQIWLRPMLRDFSNRDVCNWARALDQEIFTGSSGRVFPTVMKASPLLRNWLQRLNAARVSLHTRWEWVGFSDRVNHFNTPDGPQEITARATVLALGGASWRRLGARGTWAEILGNKGVDIAPFRPANMGFQVNWSVHMQKHFGQPIKPATLSAGPDRVRGEFVIGRNGIEGSAVYALSARLREGAPLIVDLMPDTSQQQLQARLLRANPKNSLSNILRKSLRLPAAKIALFHECTPKVTQSEIPTLIKNLPLAHLGPRPIDEAISTAGGVMQSALNTDLMLHQCAGVFCAGEMLDWEAPTGGYLISGCLATGRWAAQGAIDYLASNSAARRNISL